MAAISDIIMLRGCHENQLRSTWFRLIESTKNAQYMCQISSQSDKMVLKVDGRCPIDPPPLPPYAFM